jgi:hypothetical protein
LLDFISELDILEERKAASIQLRKLRNESVMAQNHFNELDAKTEINKGKIKKLLESVFLERENFGRVVRLNNRKNYIRPTHIRM